MVRLGDEQDMALVDRMDVEEGDGVVGLEDHRRGDLPPDDLAEQAARLSGDDSRARHGACGSFGAAPAPDGRPKPEPISS